MALPTSPPHDTRPADDTRPAGPLRATPWTRLHFAWALVWGALVTPPLAAGLLVHNLVDPSARTFKRWMTVWGRVVLAGIGVRLRVEVEAPIPDEEPVVLVANHQNMLDIVTCAAGIPHPYGFAAKAELRGTPIIGAIIARCACVFVDKSSARRAAETIREAGVLIRQGNSVLVYPEGVRTHGPELADFQRGAFVLAAEAGVPVVPVVQPENYALVDERRRISRPGIVRLVVGRPVPTGGVARREAGALAEAVRQRMLAMLAGLSPDGPPPAPAVSSGTGLAEAPPPAPRPAGAPASDAA